MVSLAISKELVIYYSSKKSGLYEDQGWRVRKQFLCSLWKLSFFSSVSLKFGGRFSYVSVTPNSQFFKSAMEVFSRRLLLYLFIFFFYGVPPLLCFIHITFQTVCHVLHSWHIYHKVIGFLNNLYDLIETLGWGLFDG